MIAADPWVIGLLALAGGVSVLAALRRGRRQFVATLVAVAALFGLALAPPAGAPVDDAVLLTQGASASGLTSDRSSLAPIGGVYAVGDDPSWPRWVERLDDVGVLVRRPEVVGRLTILGHGVDRWDAERLAASDRIEIATADLPSMPEGVTRISWRRDLVVGQPLVVDGTLTGGGTLRLEGPGGRIERVASSRTHETPFTLELVPPGSGRFLFDLVLERAGGEERVGTIDIHVRDIEPPAILWLEGAPSFETRHAKQWLADAGGSVAVRTTVSRDRSRYEYHNLDRLDLSRLTEDRLANFDVLVVDDDAWAELSSSERQAAERAIRSGSLGIVLRLELGDGDTSNVPFGFTARRIADLEELMVRPAALADPPDPIDVPPYELDGSGVPLFRDRAGRTLALRRPLGRGAVAVTALTGSYRWVLEGRADAHRAYWIALLEAVVPTDDRSRWLLPAGPLPEHEPLTVILAGEPAGDVVLLEPDGRRATVPMRQHPTRPDRFSATLRPRLTGWHQLETGYAVALFHATARADWQAWQATRRRDATARAADNTAGGAHASDRHTPVLRFLALALLLVTLAWAWIDERRSGVAG